jgi:hypothetical protein
MGADEWAEASGDSRDAVVVATWEVSGETPDTAGETPALPETGDGVNCRAAMEARPDLPARRSSRI